MSGLLAALTAAFGLVTALHLLDGTTLGPLQSAEALAAASVGLSLAAVALGAITDGRLRVLGIAASVTGALVTAGLLGQTIYVVGRAFVDGGPALMP